MDYSNLAQMFHSISEKLPNSKGMMYKEDDEYKVLNKNELQDRVNNFAAGLLKAGVKKGDRVLLLSENRVEWALSDYAVLSTGALTVPIYPTLLPSHIEYIINNSEGKILILSDTHQLNKIKEIRNRLRMIELIIVMDGEAEKGIITWQDNLETGKKYLADNPNCVKETYSAIEKDDLASIIYTSGTTGLPKGVMLSHGNFLSNVSAALQVVKVDNTDTFLSFLPLSHVFERMVGHFLAYYSGATIAYAESIETVPQNLHEVRPTIMASVPRFFEKIYARILDSLEDGSAVKKQIFLWAIEVGKKAALYLQKGRELPGFLKVKYNLADKLVYTKLKERVGGNIRFFVSGGAPLSREIAEFFNSAGLKLLEGYGLTESSPVISVNTLEKLKPGSVGPKLPNVEVKIASDGEILTRGPHIMRGYYKDDAATADMIDDEKWLHTGDIGHLDSEGYLFITDRKKNIIVTSGGKNVAPAPIENLILTTPMVEQVMVVGDKRKFCTALIVPDLTKVQSFADDNEIKYDDVKELLNNEFVLKKIQTDIDLVSVDLASYETIKKFTLLPDPFTLENGELTPSLKIKRNVIEEKFAEAIDKMYEGIN